jgi:hypothetical protein
MPNPRLAASLTALQALVGPDGRVLKSTDLGRTDRERLVEAGFLQEVLKGWLITTRPGGSGGDTTSWYITFWDFCKAYLSDKFGTDWVLSPEASIPLHVGNRTVPQQLIIHSPAGSNHKIDLLHGTSVYDLKRPFDSGTTVEIERLPVYRLSTALCLVGPAFFQQNRNDAAAALGAVRTAGEILDPLLSGGHVRSGGRLAGAFRAIGRVTIADQILESMRGLHHDIREDNPFEAPVVNFGERSVPPVVARIKMMWADMRVAVMEEFTYEPSKVESPEAYLRMVDENYQADAYNSLSIEGYQVTAELIEKVKSGDWKPEDSDEDRDHKNALAAKGYWGAFQSVKASIAKILEGASPAKVAEDDHQRWFRELFLPTATVGLIKPERLAGYRSHPVYIRTSMHVPINHDMVPDAMEAMFDCMRAEKDARVLAVLGHFIFTFIHPYMDGNGRSGRFMMNAMLSSGGYPWTIIPVTKRRTYMEALETASVQMDIRPFTRFVVECMKVGHTPKATAEPELPTPRMM